MNRYIEDIDRALYCSYQCVEHRLSIFIYIESRGEFLVDIDNNNITFLIMQPNTWKYIMSISIHVYL